MGFSLMQLSKLFSLFLYLRLLSPFWHLVDFMKFSFLSPMSILLFQCTANNTPGEKYVRLMKSSESE